MLTIFSPFYYLFVLLVCSNTLIFQLVSLTKKNMLNKGVPIYLVKVLCYWYQHQSMYVK